jgi:hypothetical protein
VKEIERTENAEVYCGHDADDVAALEGGLP